MDAGRVRVTYRYGAERIKLLTHNCFVCDKANSDSTELCSLRHSESFWGLLWLSQLWLDCCQEEQ